MNHVFISGFVENAPELLSRENEIPHVIMSLTVIHRTASGIEKREMYPISAWRGIAIRMKELIKPNMRVSIKGYLSQKQTDEGIFLEVTAEEFQVAYQNGLIRPLRRTGNTQKYETEEKKQSVETSNEKNESMYSMSNNE